jgi:hypothetical protein
MRGLMTLSILAPGEVTAGGSGRFFIKPVTTLLCSVVVLFAVRSPGRSSELKVL